MGFIEKLFGTYSEREVKRLGSVVDKIESLDKSMQKLSDDELRNKTAEFKDRLSKGETLDDILEKVKNIAKGAALMTGATLEMSRYELPNDNLKTHENLSSAFMENLKALGIEDIHGPKETGSSDIGNVSHKTATIHPYLSISNCPLTGHSVQMANATITDLAHERLGISLYRT